MTKKEVGLIDYSKPLKQQKSWLCVVQPNFIVSFPMNNNCILLAIVKIKTNLNLAYAVYYALHSDIIKYMSYVHLFISHLDR